MFPGGRWVPCRLGAVEAFRWVASPERREATRRSWLARVFEVPEGEPTDAQLGHIASLSPGERLWFERGVLVGGTVVVPHEALSDTPAFLDTRRLMRRFRCSVCRERPHTSAAGHVRWSPRSLAAARARDFGRALRAVASGGVYVNDLSHDRVRAAYGANYERRTALKQQYEPDNLFRLNPNITPAP